MEQQQLCSRNVSVVICCHAVERYQDICEAIASLRAQLQADDEVVVVVDHNANLLSRLEQTRLAEIQIVENRYARGLSGARNTGVAATSGAYIVFLDDDAVAAPRMVDFMRTALDTDAKVLGVAGWIDPIWVDIARPCWFPPQFLWVVGCSYEGLKPGPVRNLIGAAMALRRSVFERAGGFTVGVGRGESRLPLGCEETELCIRAASVFRDATFIQTADSFCGHKVPAQRATWFYFLKRCFAEGISKAHIFPAFSEMAALSVEGNYVATVLSKAVLDGLRDTLLKHDVGGIMRIFAVVLGLGATLLGYATGWGRSTFAPDRSAGPRPFRVAIAAAYRRSASIHTMMLFKGLTFATSNIVGAALGFAFWWFAAHNFAPKAVGSSAATISLINLVGQAGEAGLGALLIGRIPRMKADTPTLIASAFVAAAAICFSLAALTVALSFCLNLGYVAGSWGARAAFVLAVTITGITLVLDQALIGLLRAGTQMWRSITFNVSKLALLAMAASVYGHGTGEGTILATWIAGSLVPLGLLIATSRKKGISILYKPSLGMLRPLFLEVLGHHCLNVAVLAPCFALPLVVTAILSPTANAAFYALWAVLNAVLLVPAAMTTVLFSAGTYEPNLLKSRLNVSLAISTALCLAAGIFLFFLSPNVLALFNPAYPSIASGSLNLLGFGTLGVMLKFHFVTTRRLAGQTLKPAALLAVAAAFELGLAALGGHHLGLRGVTIGWLTALVFEAAFMLPSLLLSPSRRADKEKFSAVIEAGAS